MFIVDTDILSEWHKGNEAVRARVAATPDWELFTTIVTRIEMLKARFDFLLKAADAPQLKRAQQRLIDTERLLEGISILTINESVASTFDRLKDARGLGKIGRPDLLIACFALAHNATLVTRNTKDFIRIPNLRLENWLDD